MTFNLTTDEKKLPKGRKKRKQLKSRLYSSYKISRELRDALMRYKKARKNMSYEIIINNAFTELEQIWEREKNKPIKNKMILCLVYNPPPNPKVKVAVRLRFDRRFSVLIDAILAEPLFLSRNTTDFIERALSWYLRKEGFLEQKGEQLNVDINLS